MSNVEDQVNWQTGLGRNYVIFSGFFFCKGFSFSLVFCSYEQCIDLGNFFF